MEADTKQPIIGDIRPVVDDVLLRMQAPEVRRKLTSSGRMTAIEYHVLMRDLRMHHAVESAALKDVISALKRMKDNREAMLRLLDKTNRKLSRGNNDGHESNESADAGERQRD